MLAKNNIFEENFLNLMLILYIELITKVKPHNVVTSSHLESSTVNLSTLDQVQIVFRHGISVPENDVLYLSDNKIEDISWPSAPGELTTDGKYYQLKLAQYLRKRYKGFISSEYIRDEVGMFTSSSKSCKESLKILFQELYSNSNRKDSLHNTLDNIDSKYTIPELEDNILKMSKSCEKWDDLYKNAKEEVNDKLNGLSITVDGVGEGKMNMEDYISHHSGVNGRDLDEIRKLHTKLIAQTFCNISLPSWGATLLNSKSFINLVKGSYKALTYTEEMKRLKGGPLLKTIGENFHTKPGNGMILYSGHAATIASLLNIFSAFELEFLEYSGALIFELHGSNIHIFYRNEIEEKEIAINIEAPNIDGACLSKYCMYKHIDFDTLCALYGVENYDDECDLTDGSSQVDFPLKELLSAVFLLTLFPILLYIFVKILYFKSKNDEFSPLLRTHKVF